VRAAQQTAEDVLCRWDGARERGRTVSEFALEEGMKLDTVQTILRRARARGDERGNYTREPRKVTRPRFPAVLAAWNEADPTLSYAAFAESIGTTHAAVNAILYRARREGLEVRPPSARRNPALDEWQHLREGGTSIYEAASRLGVTVDYLRSNG
jgi:hypothetical protein